MKNLLLDAYNKNKYIRFLTSILVVIAILGIYWYFYWLVPRQNLSLELDKIDSELKKEGFINFKDNTPLIIDVVEPWRYNVTESRTYAKRMQDSFPLFGIENKSKTCLMARVLLESQTYTVEKDVILYKRDDDTIYYNYYNELLKEKLSKSEYKGPEAIYAYINIGRNYKYKMVRVNDYSIELSIDNVKTKIVPFDNFKMSFLYKLYFQID